MINPFSKIDATNLNFTLPVSADVWFDPEEVEMVDICIEGFDQPGVKDELLKVYASWDVDVTDDGSKSDDFMYALAPPGVHCNEDIIKRAKTDTFLEHTPEYCELNRHFSYAVFGPQQKVIGVVTGNFVISGDYEINAKKRDSKEIIVSCHVDAVEMSPEYRGKGFGTLVSAMLAEAGCVYFDRVFEQIPQDEIRKLNFTPRVSAELYSRSGHNWFEHLTEDWSREMTGLLSVYVPPSRINEIEYDAGL